MRFFDILKGAIRDPDTKSGNPYHEPKGTETGGRFAAAPTSGPSSVKGRDVKVGSEVKLARGLLRSTGQMTGRAPFARGRVKGFRRLGGQKVIAIVDWGKDTDAVPSKILTTGLVNVGDVFREER